MPLTTTPAKAGSFERVVVLDYNLARLTSEYAPLRGLIAALKGVDKPIIRDALEASLGRFRLMVSLQKDQLRFDTELEVRK